MTEANQNTNLKEPYNPLDPIVVFDPEYENSGIVVPWQPQPDDNTITDKPTVGTEPTKSEILKQDAIKYPLIKLNNTIIEKNIIKEFKLSIKGFLPTIYLVIKDIDGTIQTADLPGINNVITVIITAPVEGTNKKISLDFYIKNCNFENGFGTYNGEFKRLELQKTQCKQIGEEKLSTYEMLKNVAKDCKLGFAATPGCENVSDKKWRQIYSQTYNDFVLKQLEFAGVDETSVLDAWIDEFGYLVVANLYKIFKENIDEKQLVTKITKGVTNTESSEILPSQEVEEVQRIITNNNAYGDNNLFFEGYEPIIDNNSTKEHGTLNTLYYMTGACDTNTINTIQTQIIEDSVDGIEGISEYEYTKDIFMGIDMSDDGTQLLQQEIVKAFKLKYFKDKLVVDLPVANYSLQRGMLLGVLLYEYSQKNKKLILDNWSTAEELHANSDMTPTEITTDTEKTKISLLEDDQMPIQNPAISGIYYIDGIELRWSNKDPQIHQKLFLVKRGIKTKLTNKYTLPKFNK